MHILHPTDFSRTAELARALAVDLHQRSVGRLHIVHVQERYRDASSRRFQPAQSHQINPELQRLQEQQREQETRQLRQMLQALATESGDATSELVWGETLRELLRMAADYDLVVMGAYGQNPFDAAFLGGVAGRLVRRVSTPVLTVRHTSEVKQLRRLLVGVDFGPAANHAWAFAADLAQRAQLDLVLAHVDDQRRADAGAASDRLEALAATQTAKPRAASARLIVRHGNPIDVLPQLAKETGADAIVVGLRQHRTVTGLLLGSRADALLRSSATPILTVPLVAGSAA